MDERPEDGLPWPSTPTAAGDVEPECGACGLEVTVAGGVVAFAGDVDLATRSVYATALADAVAQSTGDVHVDLGGVGFLDGRAADALLRVAERLASTDRRLVVHGMPTVLRRILDVLDDPRSRLVVTLPAPRRADAIVDHDAVGEAGA